MASTATGANGDDARTIRFKCREHEELGSLSEKTAGTLGETGNQIFFRVKKEGRGKCPGDMKKKSM